MQGAEAVGAHPRSRGENARGSNPALYSQGSSPLTRGKPAGPDGPSGLRGLIPAHAGKTESQQPRRRHGRAHPRSRGENRIPSRGRPRVRGSSPLTRGKPATNSPRVITQGLIPAHAGKTRKLCGLNTSSEAHPRSRGENVREGGLRWEGLGSSPLTRGKRLEACLSVFEGGLIPAHAGKTIS